MEFLLKHYKTKIIKNNLNIYLSSDFFPIKKNNIKKTKSLSNQIKKSKVVTNDFTAFIKLVILHYFSNNLIS